MRRDVAAILAAHRLDPDRRELYVEGHRDRIFLLWLAGDALDANSKVVEIALVDIAVEEGGDRGRLIEFARQVESHPAEIRCLADADFDRYLGESVPENVWLTDLRDIESYILREDCIHRVFRLGVNTDKVAAGDLLAQVATECRRIAALRLVSIREGLRLPFQKTELHGQATATYTGVTLDLESYLRILLQNAEISLKEFGRIHAKYIEVTSELKAIPDLELAHGKDAFRLLAEVLQRYGVNRSDSDGLLFLSFERAMLSAYPTLSAVVQYLLRAETVDKA